VYSPLHDFRWDGACTVMGVYVYSNVGGAFSLNTTINGVKSFKRVKMADNHACLAVKSRSEELCWCTGGWAVLVQNITDISSPDISSVT
jgi:hypothetical protein